MPRETLCFIAYVTSYQPTKGNLRAGRSQQNRRKNKTKIRKHSRGQNIEKKDGPSTSSGPFSTSGNLLASRSAGSKAGTPVASDWNPILGMKRFMDWGQKNIIGSNMKRFKLNRNSLEYKRYETDIQTQISSILNRPRNCVVSARLCNLAHKTCSLAFLLIFSSLLKCGAAKNIPNDNNQTPMPVEIVNDSLDTNLTRTNLIIGCISAIVSIILAILGWKTNCFGCQSNSEGNQENCGRDVTNITNNNVTNHVTNNVTNNVIISQDHLELSQGPSTSLLPVVN